MKLNNWEETLHYVNRLGLVNRTMPIGWKQQVLMDNVNRIEALHNPAQPMYPLEVKYSRKSDSFTVRGLTVKASHN